MDPQSPLTVDSNAPISPTPVQPSPVAPQDVSPPPVSSAPSQLPSTEIPVDAVPNPGPTPVSTPTSAVEPLQPAPINTSLPPQISTPPETSDPTTTARTPVATAPRPPIVPIVIGIVTLILLATAGWFGWQMIRPQNNVPPSTSPPTATQPPGTNDPSSPGVGGGEGEQVVCTMDAAECPDGSYVGRTGPNCEFVCPGEATKGGLPSGEGASTPTTEGTSGQTTASWETYRNPTYNISFRYPVEWEVRDMKPYPRSDIQFRHGFGPRQGFQARGYVEASTLPMAELIEQVKMAEGGTATDQPGKVIGSLPVTVVQITKGTSSVDHWFVRSNNRTYHLTATGSVPEVMQIAETMAIE